jgi:hypothetical protein
MNEENDDVSAADRRIESGLARELVPPPEVEERIVRELASRGLIRPRRRAVPAAWIGVAAGLALLAAGFLIGRGSAPKPAEPPAPRYALFLLRGSEEGAPPAAEEAGRVEEYRDWARGLARGGRYVTGERLDDRSAHLGSGPSPALPAEEEVRGFFIVSASDFEDALAVARGCPHLRHGGRILVRPIAPV